MLLQVDVKRCSRCKQQKPLFDFYKTSQSKDGYRWQCKACHKNVDSQKNPQRRKEYSAKHYKKRKQEDPALFMWKQAKHRAWYDYLGLEFSITVEDIKIPEKCPYFDRVFEPLDPDWGYSLDRIDSTKGYIPDNIQVISKKANVMKNNATKEQLIAFAKGVLAVHSKEVDYVVAG